MEKDYKKIVLANNKKTCLGHDALDVVSQFYFALQT